MASVNYVYAVCNEKCMWSTELPEEGPSWTKTLKNALTVSDVN